MDTIDDIVDDSVIQNDKKLNVLLRSRVPLAGINFISVNHPKIDEIRELGGIVSLKELKQRIESGNFRSRAEIARIVKIIEELVSMWTNGKMNEQDIEEFMFDFVETTGLSNEQISEISEALHALFAQKRLSVDLMREISTRKIDKLSQNPNMNDSTYMKLPKIIIDEIVSEWIHGDQQFNTDIAKHFSSESKSVSLQNLPYWSEKRCKLINLLQ
jgi:uncharacterized protein with von Willebrand factor type A (vWA) domain